MKDDLLVIICGDGVALVEGENAEYKREVLVSSWEIKELSERSPYEDWRKMFDLHRRDDD